MRYRVLLHIAGIDVQREIGSICDGPAAEQVDFLLRTFFVRDGHVGHDAAGGSRIRIAQGDARLVASGFVGIAGQQHQAELIGAMRDEQAAAGVSGVCWCSLSGLDAGAEVFFFDVRDAVGLAVVLAEHEAVQDPFMRQVDERAVQLLVLGEMGQIAREAVGRDAALELIQPLLELSGQRLVTGSQLAVRCRPLAAFQP